MRIHKIFIAFLLSMPATVFATTGIPAPSAFFSATTQKIGTPTEHFNGYYFGIMGAAVGGISANDSRINADLEDSGRENMRDIDMNRKYSPMIGVSAGYGTVLKNRIYLGANIFGGFLNSTQEGDTFKSGVNDEDSYTIRNNTRINVSGLNAGVNFTPGYLLTPLTMVYADLGAVVSNVESKVRSDLNYTDGGPKHDFAHLEMDKQQYKPGIRAGVGFRTFITNRLSVGLSYIYTFYGKVNLNGREEITGNPGEYLTVNSKVSVRTQSFLLHLDYIL